MDGGRGGYNGRGRHRGSGGGSGGRYSGARGRSPRPTSQWVARDVVGSGSPVGDASSRSVSSEATPSVDGVTKKFDMMLSHNPDGPSSQSLDSLNKSPNDGNFKVVQNVPTTEPKPLKTPSTGPCYGKDISSPSTNSELNVRTNMAVENPCIISTPPLQTIGGQFSPEVQSGKSASEGSSGKDKPFDICGERSSNVVKLKTSLHIKNKALRNEKRRAQGDNIKILRPGMILLKGYISLTDQVKLVNSCRDLGRAPGGFYQPGYRDGAKLHLKMMCLGKNWDPETSKYGDTRPIDQAKPPPIPDEFQRLVKEAIQESHRYLDSCDKVMLPKKFLPPTSPSICIINFYSSSGKLGLHQDKDESQESIREGLPVVSFSLGDTAEFLFGEERDVDKAEKVELESGDVLIFGGKSRLIFHGVSTILANTAPKPLLEETHLKPGRLNLTFREY